MQSVNIVLVGDFNPVIFQPAWFELQGLIAPSESKEADIEILVKDVVAFNLNWLALQVTKDRFIAATNNEAFFEPLRDLLVGTFTILEHTPIRAIGINYESHYNVSDKSRLSQFYNRLSPKDVWREISKDTILSKIQVTIPSKKDKQGNINVTIEPSIRTDGPFFRVNNHYTLSNQTSPIIGAQESVRLIAQKWDETIKESVNIIEDIWEKV